MAVQLADHVRGDVPVWAQTRWHVGSATAGGAKYTAHLSTSSTSAQLGGT